MATLRMPAEWEPHEATWISWPKNLETFGQMLPRVEKIFLQIVGALHKGEKVNILVDDDATEERVRRMLEEAGVKRNVFFYRVKSADVWVRDYGPIFVKSGKKRLITKWIFNAWGGKYSDLAEDTQVFDRLAPSLGFEVLRPEIVLEGGSIEVNGKGTLLTTEQCLLNKNRNPQLTKAQIEGYLGDYLGASNVIWLKDGVVGDDTDGHIDDIARFVNPTTVLCALEDDRIDPNHAALRQNFELLANAKDQDGEKLEVVPLPMPGPVKGPEGRLPASYVNFYIGNDAVLLPVFDHKNDMAAISLLGKCFPGRKVVPINCEPLLWGLGTIHCSTQQQPR